MEAILDWLENTTNFDSMVVSLDTIVYGGLIPSRRSSKTLEELLERLNKLKSILKTKQTKIYAFSSIMRISNNNYNEEEKEKIKEYVEKDGYTLEYNKDGSGTLSNEEGSWYIGKGWVENEYTKNVPPIDFGTITMSSEMEEKDEKYYIFLIRDSSPMDASDYVEALKNAGFNETGHNESSVEAGVVTFTGENNNGQHIELAYSSYGFTVKILLNK